MSIPVRPGEDLRNRYRVREQIGQGGMGTVWMAQQTEPVKRVVAITHRDCGAAGIAYGKDAVDTADKETETHRKALAEFRAQMQERQPKLAVEAGLMALDGSVLMFPG